MCNITKGRTEPCLDSIGGLTSFYAIPYLKDAFTIVDGVVTAMVAGVTDAYKFDLRADANIQTSDGVSDENTGVTLFSESLVAALKKQGAESGDLVKNLHAGLYYIVGESRNGDYQLMGSLDGARVTASNISSGGARSDFNGYNLTFTSFSKTPSPFLDAPIVAALLLIESATNINP